MENYRPIAIEQDSLKEFEQVLLARLQQYLCTTDNQFGFKTELGTEMAICALKQTIAYYRAKDFPLFLCFLDARKAFDQVNHWTLLRKLIDRGTPKDLVRLLLFWFRNQEFLVKWGNSRSRPFNCANGIRQGGQLSPLFYNVYIDQLSELLRVANVGCYIGEQSVNSLSYADDVLLIAPTITALQKLVNVCNDYAEPHDIVYNTSKTVCMLVNPPR